MSAASSVGSSVGSSVASSVTVGSGGWTPNALGLNVRERTLEGGLAYASSLLSNLPVLRSLEPYGTYRAPRQGRCWKGDGINDYAVSSGNIGITGAAPRTICFRAKLAGTGDQALVSWGTPAAGGFFNAIVLFGNWYFNGAHATDWNTGVAADTNWHHHAVVYDGTNVAWYIDGVSIGQVARALNTVDSQLYILQRSNGNYPSSAYIHDIRVYNVAKSLSEIQAIYAGDYEDPDRTGLVAGYWCNEESGTLGYDWSGNGRHLTLTNITQATFHATDTGVTRNANNVHGYRLSGSVYIPADLSSPGNAADGNALTATGQTPYPVATESVCLTGDGSSVYADLGSAMIPASADFEVSFWYYHSSTTDLRSMVEQRTTGNTGTVQIIGNFNGVFSSNQLGVWLDTSNGIVSSTNLVSGQWHYIKLTRSGSVWTLLLNDVNVGSVTRSFSVGQSQTTHLLAALISGSRSQWSDGRISDLRITTGGVTTYFPLQDGPGSANLNRNLAWYKSDGTYDVVSNAIVNGTVANIWANRCPRVRDWCIENGGRVGGNLLIRSEAIESWTLVGGVGVSVVADQTANPITSEVNADEIVLANNNSHLFQRVNYAVPQTQYTYSIWLRAKTGTFKLKLSRTNGVSWVTAVVSSEITLTTEWQRYSLTFVTGVAETQSDFVIGYEGQTPYNLPASGSIYAWGGQMNKGPVALDYTKTVASPIDDRFVLGIPNSNLCADGNAKTLTAGKHGNPYSRLIPNPFTAAELNGRNLPSSLAPGGSLAGVTPSDSAFIRSAADGDDRLLITKEALTGAALAKAQEWVS